MQREVKRRKAGASLAAGQGKKGNFGALWCNFTHDSTMWPIHGEYQCGVCGRHYPVPWTENRSASANAGIGA